MYKTIAISRVILRRSEGHEAVAIQPYKPYSLMAVSTKCSRSSSCSGVN
jgi:hypothetical protein